MRSTVAFVCLIASACAAFTSLDDLRGSSPDGGDASSDGAIDASCGDLSTSTNCGRCGHDCRGGACSGGKCQPVIIAESQQYAGSIVVDGTGVFWEGLGVSRTTTTATDPTAATTVGSGQYNSNYMTAAAPNLLVLSITGDVTKLPENTPPDAAASPVWIPYGTLAGALISTWFAVDGTSAYLLTGSQSMCMGFNTCLLGSDTMGTNIHMLAAASSDSMATLHGGRVYFTNGFTVESVAMGDAQSTVLATETQGLSAIAADDTWVYYTLPLLGQVRAAPHSVGDAGAGATFVTGIAMPDLVVAGSGLLVWTSSDGIESCDPTQCAKTRQTLVPSATSSATSIAIDATSIYWTDSPHQRVYRLTR